MYGELVKRRLGEASKQQPTRQQTIYFLLYFGERTDFSLRKVKIFHFATYRFFISQSTDFSFRFSFISFRKVQ